MNSRIRKTMALTLALVLGCAALAGCSGKNKNEGGTIQAADDEIITTRGTASTDTDVILPTLMESKQDWSIFADIGVNKDEAKEIFMKLGFGEVSGLKADSADEGTYTLYPYGVKETPLSITAKDGKITSVTLLALSVSNSAKNAFYNDGELPERWYLKSDKEYSADAQDTISVKMYDTAEEAPYIVCVDWTIRKLYYF